MVILLLVKTSIQSSAEEYAFVQGVSRERRRSMVFSDQPAGMGGRRRRQEKTPDPFFDPFLCDFFGCAV